MSPAGPWSVPAAGAAVLAAVAVAAAVGQRTVRNRLFIPQSFEVGKLASGAARCSAGMAGQSPCLHLASTW